MSRDHNISMEVCDKFTELLEIWDHPEAEAVKEWVVKQRRAIEVISENRTRKNVRVGTALTTPPPPVLKPMSMSSDEMRQFITMYAEWYNGPRLEALK